MTREELSNTALDIFADNKNILLEFATGTGKTKIALEMYNSVGGICLIAVNETAHIDNWKKDIIKHGYQSLLDKITFTCYASLHKYIRSDINVLILDESHNCQSIKRLDALRQIKFNKSILLTATITKREKINLEKSIGKIHEFKYSLAEAVNSDILPKPKIHLIELELDNSNYNVEVVINRGKEADRVVIYCNYNDNWKKFLSMYKNVNLHIKCTELQKYSYLCSQIDYYQIEFYKNNDPITKNRWMQYASQRKRFISEIKTNHVKKLVSNYNGRFICFAGSIAQCNELGGKGNIVHSKIKDPSKIIGKFNDKKINQLFVVDMLREGMNLVEANVIVVQLDSKNRSAVQMVG